MKDNGVKTPEVSKIGTVVNERLKARDTIAPLFRLTFLIVLMIALSFLSEDFLTWSNIINVLRQSTFLIVIGLGLTGVLLTGGIDLSVGGVLAFVGCATGQMMRSGVPLVLAVIIGLALGAGVGFFNGLLVGYVKLPPFVATYGSKWIAEGMALALMQGQVIYGFPRVYRWIGIGYIGPIPVPIIIAAILAVIMNFLYVKTVFGRQVYALGANKEAAFYSGIKVKKNITIVYTLAGLMAGIAGLLMLARLDAAEVNMGEALQLQSLAAVIIGGASLRGGEGSMFGTIIGAITLTLVVNGLNLLGVKSLWHPVVLGGVILISVIIDLRMKKMSH